jgi:hypothetical protein
MGRPEYLIYRVPVTPLVFQNQHILLQGVNLHLSFAEKVLEEFFVIGVQIITHIINVYTHFVLRQGIDGVFFWYSGGLYDRFYIWKEKRPQADGF